VHQIKSGAVRSYKLLYVARSAHSTSPVIFFGQVISGKHRFTEEAIVNTAVRLDGRPRGAR